MDRICDILVRISIPYLGPAAPDFYRHCVKSYLNKRLEDLQAEDLPELKKWVKPYGMLFIGRDKCERMCHEIEKEFKRIDDFNQDIKKRFF